MYKMPGKMIQRHNLWVLMKRWALPYDCMAMMISFNTNEWFDVVGWVCQS